MALVKLREDNGDADRYREWLEYYTKRDGDTDAHTRTQAFVAAIRGERPSGLMWGALED